MNKKVIELKNQGFCYGVKNSIKIVCDALKKDLPKPIYLLNNLVHNKFVSEYFKKQGIIVLKSKTKLEAISSIEKGTVIISAHGVGDIIYEKAKEKNLTIVDATCPFVKKSYDLIKAKLNDGYSIIYIGKENHPETEAVLSFSPFVYLNDGSFKNSKLALSHQTTMSDYDVKSVYEKISLKYPDIEILDAMCSATKIRQDELKEAIEKYKSETTLFIVVGDKNSNNCTKLKELAQRKSCNVCFVNDFYELDFDLTKYDRFILSSGTSTPLVNIKNIKKFLQNERICDTFDIENYIK